MNWQNISDEDQLAILHKRSFDPGTQAVLIFKHSPRCSISVMAKDRLERKWSLDPEKYPVFLIDVLAARPASLRVADQYEVEHQSPQLLVIKNGISTYNASHSGISYDEISGFLNS
ncbi:MAG TPA: bacillithiol system redox-active protein YtxJ [Bacteroidia bacterium]|jgi:bacillithiol system protein YtxJ